MGKSYHSEHEFLNMKNFSTFVLIFCLAYIYNNINVVHSTMTTTRRPAMTTTPCPDGMVPVTTLHHDRRHPRSDDQSRTIQCVMAGFALQHAGNHLSKLIGGGAEDPTTPSPHHKRKLPDDYMCLNDDDDTESDTLTHNSTSSSEDDEYAHYFIRDHRRIQFMSNRIWLTQYPPQNLSAFGFPFNYWDTLVVPANLRTGHMTDLRHIRAGLFERMGEVLDAIADVTRFQEEHIQKFVSERNKGQMKQFMKKFKSATCIGIDRDYTYELEELRRQQRLVQDALRLECLALLKNMYKKSINLYFIHFLYILKKIYTLFFFKDFIQSNSWNPRRHGVSSPTSGSRICCLLFPQRRERGTDCNPNHGTSRSDSAAIQKRKATPGPSSPTHRRPRRSR